MLAKERHKEHKKVDSKTYIQVTETRYKWTWFKIVNSKLRVQWDSGYPSTTQVVSHVNVSRGSGKLPLTLRWRVFMEEDEFLALGMQ